MGTNMLQMGGIFFCWTLSLGKGRRPNCSQILLELKKQTSVHKFITYSEPYTGHSAPAETSIEQGPQVLGINRPIIKPQIINLRPSSQTPTELFRPCFTLAGHAILTDWCMASMVRTYFDHTPLTLTPTLHTLDPTQATLPLLKVASLTH